MEIIRTSGMLDIDDEQCSHTAADRYYSHRTDYVCGVYRDGYYCRLYMLESGKLLMSVAPDYNQHRAVAYPLYPGSSLFSGDNPSKQTAVEFFCQFMYACVGDRMIDIAARITAARNQAMEAR
jgi:hypothetical protein